MAKKSQIELINSEIIIIVVIMAAITILMMLGKIALKIGVLLNK